jgi:3-mercaptopyruvate sulfurtransferase SseA
MPVKRIRKRYILPVVIIVILLCASGCSHVTGNTTVTSEASSVSTQTTVSTIPGHSITIQDAKTILDNHTQTAVFIDVRTQADYDTLRIPGAALIPVAELANRLSEVPKDKQVIVYAQCR